jgi:hypothetical protein
MMEDKKNQQLQRNIKAIAAMVFINAVTWTTVIVAITNPSDSMRSRAQFQHWYPQFETVLSSLVDTTCHENYTYYLTGNRSDANQTVINYYGRSTAFVEPLISCILQNSSQYMQYALNTSQVMLGLTPTIISILGASSEEMCLLALVGRRRFLALLLSAASPSIYTSRAFEYRNLAVILHEEPGRNHVRSTLHRKHRRIIIILEYFFAGAALSNVATISWQLGLRTINNINPNVRYIPTLWSVAAIPLHFLGLVIFGLRLRRIDSPHRTVLESKNSLVFRDFKISQIATQSIEFVRTLLPRIWSSVQREFWMHPEQGPDEKIHVQWFKESRLFLASAYLLSIFIIFHIILGTLVLASTNFIGPADAIGIMARYIVSVIICRVILMYELAVVKECYNSNGSLDVNIEEKDYGIWKLDSNVNEKKAMALETVASIDDGPTETITEVV